MSSSDFSGGKKETVYSGPAPAQRGTVSPGAGNKGSYGSVYDGPSFTPGAGTVYNDPAQGSIGHSGPAPRGTVYTPARHSQGASTAAHPAASEKVKKTANLFFLIAGLSMVNTVLAFAGASMAMALGLGATRLDVAVHQGNAMAPILLLSLVGPLIFLMIGIFARQGSSAAFLIGMLLYAGDTGFLFLDGAALHAPSIVVHMIFLGSMFGGYRMTRE